MVLKFKDSIHSEILILSTESLCRLIIYKDENEIQSYILDRVEFELYFQQHHHAQVF